MVEQARTELRGLMRFVFPACLSSGRFCPFRAREEFGCMALSIGGRWRGLLISEPDRCFRNRFPCTGARSPGQRGGTLENPGKESTADDVSCGQGRSAQTAPGWMEGEKPGHRLAAAGARGRAGHGR
jgi:hypothetical protein